jgi:hypothetical protein
LAASILAGVLLGCSKDKPQPPEPVQPSAPSEETTQPQPSDVPSPDQLGWVHQIPGHDFEITLLGKGWKLNPRASHRIANFHWPEPAIICSVVLVVKDESGAKYEEHIKRFQDINNGNPAARNTAESRGTNDHGHPVWLLTSDDRQDGQTMFAGVSLTWLNRKKTVLMVFEGHFSSDNPSDMRRERIFFRLNANAALRSLRPIGTP